MNKQDKVIVIGAHGQVGQHVVRKLAATEHCQPVAFLRKESQKDVFAGLDTDLLIGDLEDSVDALCERFSGADAIVFAAGSGGDSGADKTLAVDLEGAARSIEAAVNAGVGRFIMLSAAGADNRAFWDESGMKPYYIAKHYADEALRGSSLDYTIVRPVRLTNEPGTDCIAVSESGSVPAEEIPREDVAGAIVALLGQARSQGRTLTISSGGQSISSALGANPS